jgi:hypothetical protein
MGAENEVPCVVSKSSPNVEPFSFSRRFAVDLMFEPGAETKMAEPGLLNGSEASINFDKSPS